MPFISTGNCATALILPEPIYTSFTLLLPPPSPHSPSPLTLLLPSLSFSLPPPLTLLLLPPSPHSPSPSPLPSLSFSLPPPLILLLPPPLTLLLPPPSPQSGVGPGRAGGRAGGLQDQPHSNDIRLRSGRHKDVREKCAQEVSTESRRLVPSECECVHVCPYIYSSKSHPIRLCISY